MVTECCHVIVKTCFSEGPSARWWMRRRACSSGRGEGLLEHSFYFCLQRMGGGLRESKKNMQGTYGEHRSCMHACMRASGDGGHQRDGRCGGGYVLQVEHEGLARGQCHTYLSLSSSILSTFYCESTIPSPRFWCQTHIKRFVIGYSVGLSNSEPLA